MRSLMRWAATAPLAAALAACGNEPTESDTVADTFAASAETAAPAAPPHAIPEASGAEGANDPPEAFAQCQSCHSPEPGKNGVGPSLAGIFGEKAAEVPDYAFSSAMQESGLTWDQATLDRYLAAPQDVVPGTKMTFAGLKDDAKRSAVIDYLKSIG